MVIARRVGLLCLALVGSIGMFPSCHGEDIGEGAAPPGADGATGGGGEAQDVEAGASAAAMDVTSTPGAAVDASLGSARDAVATGSRETGGEATDEKGASDDAAGSTEAGVRNPCALRSGLLFCDDFEAASAGAPSAPWSTSIVGNGTVSIDSSTPAHSGTKSIHVSDSDADYDTLLVLHDASVLPAQGGRFYVRAFIRLGAAMSAGHNTFILADLFASQGQGNNLRLGEDYQMLMYTVAGDAHGALSNANYYNDGMLPGVQFPAGTWTCLEVLLDSQKPEIDVWVGGNEVPDLHHTDYPLDDYDDLRFGFEKYAGPAMDVWYDDIAVGTQPIGCD